MTVQAGASVPWLRVSVVIPALNEARNLPHVFARLPPDMHEVIVVDGLSVDDTIAVARQLRPDVRIVMQNRRGKGTGDIIAMIDADGSTDPAEIPQFVQALIDGAEFAKGTRFGTGGGSDDITRLRALGNRALVGFVNLCHRSHYTDLCYGYNAFWRRLVPQLGLDADSPAPPNGGRLWGDGFEVETLIHLRVAAAGLAVTEVPSFEHSRIHGVSNLNAAQDGFRILRTILAELRRSHRRRRGGRALVAPVATAAVAPVVAAAVAPAEIAPEPTSLAAGRSGDWGPDLTSRAVE
jgi:glycosyltransferase involved in cell wall biosynthesis